jgi:type I restriction enzyme R subunit
VAHAMFNEANAVRDFTRDLLCGTPAAAHTRAAHQRQAAYGDAPAADGLGWHFVPGALLPRAETDVLVEADLRAALIRLNPEIDADHDRADQVIYRLRAILLTVTGAGLVGANEEFTAWLRGEKTMPFGPNNEHTTVRLIDFEHLSNNHFVAATEVTLRAPEKRFDLVLYANGIPLVIGEAKTPTRPAVSWLDGAAQVHDDYEQSVPAFFAPNVFSFVTEGKTFRFGSIRMPLDLWAPWREDVTESETGLAEVRRAVRGLLRPDVVLDILRHFTLFATDKQHRKIKLICRYQQYYAANAIVQRVARGQIRKGLIWHFQGSGKSLLMVFTAQKLRLHPALANPTVLIVVDRVDLDTQITATFNATDVPNLVTADTGDDLQALLARRTRKVIITTIHLFADMPANLVRQQADHHVVIMVDEAHRTQEGALGQAMRDALPDAFLFGFTGTPINKRDRNTFWAFGAAEDDQGYLSRYTFEESIRDRATLPLHFEARQVGLRVDQSAIDAAFAEATEHAVEAERAELSRRAAKLAVLLKTPERIEALARDIVAHFREKVEPNGFKAQIVVYDRESCFLIKQALDRLLPPEAGDIVMEVYPNEIDYKPYDRSRNDEEKLLDRFRDPSDPLKFLIVTSKLLTGFDAPILQAMYLDKPLKEHTLLQAICRVNRPYPGKSHGLIVDYLGIFDDVSQALDFDERSIQQVITNIEALKAQVPEALAACLQSFPGVDRTVSGYEGLLAAQECLPNNEARDAFARDYSRLTQLWEALSPDSSLASYRADYQWLTQVYESVKPPSGQGKLLWHVLGAKTIELIHQHVHVETVRDDLGTLVMDADFLADLLSEDDADPRKAKEIEFKIIGRLRRHQGDPKFIALGRRLEELKARHEQGQLTSLAFLKSLLEIAKDVVEAEKAVDPVEEQDRGKACLTELFEEVRNQHTPVVVERIVADVDDIVRTVRFPGWQQTIAGEREVKQALRKTLFKYKLHQQQDIFDRAYAYIEQYY